MNFANIAKAIHDKFRSGGGWVDEMTGMRYLGNGSFGAAFDIGDGRILKVAEGLDATCVWIQASAEHFAKHGAPGRAMPVVWEFVTALSTKTIRKRITIQPETYTRMPDGSLVKVAARREYREFEVQQAWWYAVMEKVEVYNPLPWEDNDYVCEWGRERGIHNTDIYPKNCGVAADGRHVTFDPFWREPPAEQLAKLTEVRTGYTGPKAYKATDSEPTTGRHRERHPILDAGFAGREAKREAAKAPYLPEGVPHQPKWQAMRHGPIGHGRRWA